MRNAPSFAGVWSVLRAGAVAALAVGQPALLFAQAGSGGRNAPAQIDEPYVVVVSFDGFRYDYLDRGETPNFDRVARTGVRADALIPVFPSKTFPNHYSIATGMYAENHGIVSNEFWDPAFNAAFHPGDRSVVEDGRWYGGEPIWVTAEKQGMVSASFFFVGSEADIQGIHPTYYELYDGRVPNEARVDTVLSWLRLPPERRPHILTLYFSDVDNAGHAHGPDSPEVDRAVQKVDGDLGRLLDGIEALPIADEVNLVLVSDHGMEAVSSRRVEYLEDFIETDGMRFMEGGALLTLWIDGAPDRVATLEAELNRGLRHAHAYRRSEMPARWHYAGNDRVGDMIVMPEPGYQILATRGRPAGSGGTHGFDPTAAPSMRGIFLATGPRIRSGLRIPAFENVNIYPLIAHILGLRPNPEADGRLDVLRPILAPVPATSTRGAWQEKSSHSY